jgi:hypothetical protein
MADREKILTIARAPWSDEAARLLATTLRGEPCFSVEDMRREIESSPDTELFGISTEEGATVAYVVMRVERYQGGAEGVLVAAAGKLAGAQLYSQVLPVLEGMFRGVISVRANPCRAGAIKHLLAAGYRPTHVTMRKPGPMPDRGELAGAELIEALALASDAEALA